MKQPVCMQIDHNIRNVGCFEKEMIRRRLLFSPLTFFEVPKLAEKEVFFFFFSGGFFSPSFSHNQQWLPVQSQLFLVDILLPLVWLIWMFKWAETSEKHSKTSLRGIQMLPHLEIKRYDRSDFFFQQ
jgi:hypothetical protein